MDYGRDWGWACTIDGALVVIYPTVTNDHPEFHTVFSKDNGYTWSGNERVDISPSLPIMAIDPHDNIRLIGW